MLLNEFSAFDNATPNLLQEPSDMLVETGSLLYQLEVKTCIYIIVCAIIALGITFTMNSGNTQERGVNKMWLIRMFACVVLFFGLAGLIAKVYQVAANM